MQHCESYIVRIYRRDEKDPAGIVGLVEVVETGEVKKFAGGDELNAVLCNRRKEKKPPVKSRKTR